MAFRSIAALWKCVTREKYLKRPGTSFSHLTNGKTKQILPSARFSFKRDRDPVLEVDI